MSIFVFVSNVINQYHEINGCSLFYYYYNNNVLYELLTTYI